MNTPNKKFIKIIVRLVCILNIFNCYSNTAYSQSVTLSVNSQPVFDKGKRDQYQVRNDSSIQSSTDNNTEILLSSAITYITKNNNIFRLQLVNNYKERKELQNSVIGSNSATSSNNQIITDKGIEIGYGKKSNHNRLTFFRGAYLGYLYQTYTAKQETKYYLNNIINTTQTSNSTTPKLIVYSLGVYLDTYYNFTNYLALGATVNSWLGFGTKNGIATSTTELKNNRNSIIDKDIYTEKINANYYHGEFINFKITLLYTFHFKHQ